MLIDEAVDGNLVTFSLHSKLRPCLIFFEVHGKKINGEKILEP